MSSLDAIRREILGPKYDECIRSKGIGQIDLNDRFKTMGQNIKSKYDINSAKEIIPMCKLKLKSSAPDTGIIADLKNVSYTERALRMQEELQKSIRDRLGKNPSTVKTASFLSDAFKTLFKPVSFALGSGFSMSLPFDYLLDFVEGCLTDKKVVITRDTIAHAINNVYMMSEIINSYILKLEQIPKFDYKKINNIEIILNNLWVIQQQIWVVMNLDSTTTTNRTEFLIKQIAEMRNWIAPMIMFFQNIYLFIENYLVGLDPITQPALYSEKILKLYEIVGGDQKLEILEAIGDLDENIARLATILAYYNKSNNDDGDCIGGIGRSGMSTRSKRAFVADHHQTPQVECSKDAWGDADDHYTAEITEWLKCILEMQTSLEKKIQLLNRLIKTSSTAVEAEKILSMIEATTKAKEVNKTLKTTVEKICKTQSTILSKNSNYKGKKTYEITDDNKCTVSSNNLAAEEEIPILERLNRLFN